MFAPWMLYFAAGHFARDLLPKELMPLPSLTGGAPQAPAQLAPEPPPMELPPRPPLGPVALDADIPEDYERAVWNAYSHDEADPGQILAFASSLEEEGLPMAAGLLRARSLELGRIREAMRLQEMIMRRGMPGEVARVGEGETPRAGGAAPAVRRREERVPAPVPAPVPTEPEIEGSVEESIPPPAAASPLAAPQVLPRRHEASPAPSPAPKPKRTRAKAVIVPIAAAVPIEHLNGSNGATMPAPPEEADANEAPEL